MFKKNVTIWVGGGDSSVPVEVKKGTRVRSPLGYTYKAGYEKHKKLYYLTTPEWMFILEVYGIIASILESPHLKSIGKFQKLDLKTRYELLKRGIKISNTIPFHLDLSSSKDVAHLYDDYEQFKNVIKFYVPNISEDTIRKAILLTSNKGQIVALDTVCSEMISNERKLKQTPQSTYSEERSTVIEEEVTTGITKTAKTINLDTEINSRFEECDNESNYNNSQIHLHNEEKKNVKKLILKHQDKSRN